VSDRPTDELIKGLAGIIFIIEFQSIDQFLGGLNSGTPPETVSLMSRK